MGEDDILPKPQLLPSQLEFLRGYTESLRTLAARPDLRQSDVDQHIQESLGPVLETQGGGSAAFRLAVAALSSGASRDPITSNMALETIVTSPLLREDGRQIVAGLLGMATTLRDTQAPEDETTQRLAETASSALGTIRRSEDYGNPSMRTAELAVLSFYAGATLRNADYDAIQQLMDYASGLVPNTLT